MGDVLFHGELDFVIPPKSNRYFHTGRKFVFIPQRIREAVEDAILILRSMYSGKPINKPVTVEIRYSFKDNRKRDLDNLTKTLLDVLEDAGILDDDKFVYKLSIEKKVKQEEEKTEIRILRYHDKQT
ncbi:MAG: RusA family crossover junction endodeoxyribonuclease [Sulfurihydrogenibium sp.]|nr:RusA family crossover junction endodeoxyribonuclease [Sulfurihydrogenibium sp.]